MGDTVMEALGCIVADNSEQCVGGSPASRLSAVLKHLTEILMYKIKWEELNFT